jgi:hypothetical protein
LTLVEKMVNSRNILDSPHCVPNKSKTPGQPVPQFNFNPTQYLISTQKVGGTSLYCVDLNKNE